MNSNIPRSALTPGRCPQSVLLWPRKSDEQKACLAEEIAKDVIDVSITEKSKGCTK